ncbi:ATPase-stabilizing protein [Zygosaccharomyces mellis]|uniref:ATPase-stabilizing protein n=1 Tax=Zygosaccharomyces mellis TaxID=42258 RepID=A0A4C2DZ94_9SACH|nr:ATPase-stabilizing protein [Zygosaccharomyces mellis]
MSAPKAMAQALAQTDPNLEERNSGSEVEKPEAAPKEIKTTDVRLKRVARPIRHVKHIPLKSLIFYSKRGPVEFSYDGKIKLPIPKNKVVVEVSYAGLNPVDLKIKNGYQTGIYGSAGLGREFSGVITHVGEGIQSEWNEGDEVYGILFHPRQAVGALQTSILVDPRTDPIMLKPLSLSMKEAAGALYTLGTAYNILDKLERKGSLKKNSNICIIGGTTSVGMAAIQLLKKHYNLYPLLTVVTRGNGHSVLKKKFPSIADELVFINYLTCRGKISGPLKRMIEEGQTTDYEDETNEEYTVEYNQGKYDIILDFVGGYDALAHSNSLIRSGGYYVTTVGDYVANYKEDVYNSADNPSANMRKAFGSMFWLYNYMHFQFDPSVSSSKKNNWMNKCNDLLENKTIKVVVDKTYDWKMHKEALSYMATQRAQGKIILKVEKF